LRELVRLELPGGRITLWGHVVRKAEGIGFGFRFAPFQEGEDRRKLELLVRAEARRAAQEGKKSLPFQPSRCIEGVVARGVLSTLTASTEAVKP
jgi:hypothetical protein